MKFNALRLRVALVAGMKSALASWNSERDRYNLELPSEELSTNLLAAVKQVRGPGRPPAIIVHGVMPRSGTVYCGELVRLHSDIVAYPYELWEVPLLQATREIDGLHSAFVRGYRSNADRLGNAEFMAIIGAAFIGYLYAALPAGKRLLIKVPRAAYLGNFATMFPMEDSLFLMRDGRNLTQSTLKTWPDKSFEATAKSWNDATRLMLKVLSMYKGDRVCKMYRYEELAADPSGFAQSLCENFDLDPDLYPFEKVQSLPTRGASSTSQAGQVDWSPKEKPRGFKSSEHWKNWGESKRERFKIIAGSTLIESGYEKNSDW